MRYLCCTWLRLPNRTRCFYSAWLRLPRKTRYFYRAWLRFFLSCKHRWYLKTPTNFKHMNARHHHWFQELPDRRNAARKISFTTFSSVCRLGLWRRMQCAMYIEYRHLPWRQTCEVSIPRRIILPNKTRYFYRAWLRLLNKTQYFCCTWLRLPAETRYSYRAWLRLPNQT